MTQLIAVLVSFSIIPILIRLKFKLSYTLFITVGFLFLLSSLGLETLGKVLSSIIIEQSSRDTILTVIMVTLLGGLMKHYKILDKIVETILLLISSKKNILMIIPAMLGILSIPGGALLSAPFIDDIGEDMNIKPSRRAAINLSFRHLALILLPYATSLLIVAVVLPSFNIYKLISLNLIFASLMVIIGYFIFLRDIESESLPPRKNIIKNLLRLALYTSPIYVAVIINSITGLPFYITLIASILIVYFLGDKKDFFKVLIESLNWDTILTLIAVLMMKETIISMEGLIALFNNLLKANESMFAMMGILLISSAFFGFITGNFTASIAIMFPMLVQINITGELIYFYTYFVFGSAFVGYYFSPLHLCQAFTVEYMNVSTGDLYIEYKVFAPMLLLALLVSAVVIKFFMGV